MEAEAGDPHYGKTLKPYLESSSALTDVHVQEVDLPINPIPKGTRSGALRTQCLHCHLEPALGALSQVMKNSLVAAIGAATISHTVGLIKDFKEVQERFVDEVSREGLEWQYSCQMYFAWAKKRV